MDPGGATSMYAVGILYSNAGISTYNTAVLATGYGEFKGLCLQDNAACITAWTSAGPFTGSGTSNMLARWTSSTNLSTGVTYDNGTNVGIGTTVPLQKLDINGSLRVRGNVITDSANGTRITLGATTTLTNTTTTLSGTTTLTASSLGTFTTAAALNIGGATTLTFTSDNLVLNGSDAANGNLTLQGTSNATRTSSYVVVQPNGGNVGIGTTTVGYPLTFKAPSMAAGEIASFTGSTGQGIVLYTGGAGGFSAISASSGRLDLGGGGNLSILGSGYVGIGTTSPTSIFEVEAADGVADFNTVAEFANLEATAGRNFGVYIKGGSNASDYALRIQNYGGTDIFRILGNGNVGIGTTAPATPLHVHSTSASTDRRLTLTDATTGSSSLDGVTLIKASTEEAWLWNYENAKFHIGTNNAEVITILTNSYVGIGSTNPGYRLELPNTASTAGQGRANAWQTYSDQRYKTNVTTISNSLNKVLQLRGVNYNWINGGQYSSGFIAQEVENIIPELVSTDANGYKSLDYGRFTPYLVESIKLQQNAIFDLSTKLDNLSVTSTGEIAIAGQTQNYVVTKIADNSPIVRISALAEAVIGKLRAGLITTQDFVVTKTATIANLNVTNLTIGGKSLHDYVVELVLSVLQSPSSTLALQAQTSTVGTKLSTFDLAVTHDATISGTLTVNEIKAGNIQALNEQVNQLQAELATIKDTAMTSATNSMKVEQLASINLTVEDTANIHTLFVATNATIGNTVISSTGINSLADDLNLTALARIVLFDGALTIAKDGTLTTQGAVIARGGVKTNTIEPADQGGNVGVKLNDKIPSSNDKSNPKFQVTNANNTEVASIDASGSAYFAQGVNFDKYVASSSALLSSQQTWDTYGQNLQSFVTNGQVSGTGILPAGTTEILILNSKVKTASLIYVTPTGSTDNQVLYMSAKHEKTADTDHSWFKVALDKPLTHDIEFSWWVL